ncbi:MAG: thiamine phosphate synthase [Thermoanaerobaculia bacterium]
MRRQPHPPPVYAIADADALAPTPVASGVARMAEAGLRWIQVRAKSLSDRELYDQLERCCRLLEGSDATLWVDDRADLAALFPVAGVHVGQRDLPPEAVRRVVGPGLWIGLSTHNEVQLEAAERSPEVDLVALGPIFSTGSKREPDPVVGLERLRRARGKTFKPLVAIGGIDAQRVPEVLAAGADSVAVLAAVCRGDVVANCRRLLESAEACR